MNKVFKYISIIVLLSLVSGYLLLFFSPKPQLFDLNQFSTALFDEHHKLLRLSLSSDDKYRVYTPLAQIAPELIDGTLLQEDQYYYWHFGVNPVALSKAVWSTYAVGSRRVGASTITMQLARIIYKINSKKISGKLLQIIRAIQLEMHYTKAEILEAYLNLAPYGANIEGVGAASLIYFNTTANKLTLPQALTLSVIPQNPSKRTPDNNNLKSIRNQLFMRWSRIHPEDSDKKYLFDLPLVMQNIHQLPFYAPHFVQSLLSHSQNFSHQVDTTLDLKLQNIIDRITKNYIARTRFLGIHNASVLLVDTRTMSIKSFVGSGGFFDKSISGQINGVDTKRSPGSTLKPFVYGLALDQGLIHPNTVLKDVPHSFNGYNPDNFDYDFMGPIKAKDALVLSRNIPAIYLANQLQNPNLHQFLEQARVSQLKPESYYGLSLSLGGAELTMRELVSLYAMLGNEGIWFPLRSTSEEPKSSGIRLLSPEASFLVLDMLQSTHKHGMSTKEKQVSWKTGTSSGFRDAWAIGNFGPYVLGVWIGNFDNTSNPSFIGVDIAAPLFFELIHAIKQENPSLSSYQRFPQNLKLEQVKVCKASGQLPTRYCPELESTWFIPGKSPIKTDTIFREVAINPKTGLRTCHIDESTQFEVFEFWPSDLLRIFKRAGIQRHTPPFFEPDCAFSSNSSMSPQITSPQTGLKYIVHLPSRYNKTIPFMAVSDAGVAHLYWFLNETFVARTKPDEAFNWKAIPGTYVVRVVDDHGMSDARDLIVQSSNSLGVLWKNPQKC